MTLLTISLLKIFGSLLIMVFLLVAISMWTRRGRFNAELGRKLTHIGMGLYCLIFPLLFGSVWEVLTACALGVGVFAFARGLLRDLLGAGLHSVQRHCFGEFYFSISVAVLFAVYKAPWMQPENIVVYVVPLLILTISDSAAALVGLRYGHAKFEIGDSVKSWEGVAAFFCSACVLSFGALTLFTNLEPAEIAFLVLAISIFGAAIEAISVRGLDNLFVPIGVCAAYLAVTAFGGFDWTIAIGFVGAGALILCALRARRALRSVREQTT